VAYLRRLLESIAVQSYTNYEIIVTDDSPDESVKQLVEEFAAQYPISYSKNIPAAGTPENWNIAIKKSKGEWIKIMHDDDWFAQPTSLKKFAEATENSSCNFIFSACNNIFPASGKQVNEYLSGWRKEMLDNDPFNLFYLNVIGHPSTVMHRRDDRIFYDKQFKWVVDIDFYIRYMLEHKGYIYIPEMLINIGSDDTQVSNSLYKNPLVELPEYFTMLAKYKADLALKNQYVFHLVWNMLKRYRIKSIADIHTLGYTGQMPDKIEEIISCQKNIPNIVLKQTPWSRSLMMRCFKKIGYGLNK
jgi:glycosyltransferase involved in cell wall biosynthesis